MFDTVINDLYNTRSEFFRLYRLLNRKNITKQTINKNLLNIQKEYNNFVSISQSQRYSLIRNNEILKLRRKLITLSIKLKLDILLPYLIYEFVDLRQQEEYFHIPLFDLIDLEEYQISSYELKNNAILTSYENIH